MGRNSKNQDNRKTHDTKGKNHHGRNQSYGNSGGGGLTGFKTVRSGPIWNPTVKTVKAGQSKGPYTGKRRRAGRLLRLTIIVYQGETPGRRNTMNHVYIKLASDYDFDALHIYEHLVADRFEQSFLAKYGLYFTHELIVDARTLDNGIIIFETRAFTKRAKDYTKQFFEKQHTYSELDIVRATRLALLEDSLQLSLTPVVTAELTRAAEGFESQVWLEASNLKSLDTNSRLIIPHRSGLLSRAKNTKYSQLQLDVYADGDFLCRSSYLLGLQSIVSGFYMYVRGKSDIYLEDVFTSRNGDRFKTGISLLVNGLSARETGKLFKQYLALCQRGSYSEKLTNVIRNRLTTDTHANDLQVRIFLPELDMYISKAESTHLNAEVVRNMLGNIAVTVRTKTNS